MGRCGWGERGGVNRRSIGRGGESWGTYPQEDSRQIKKGLGEKGGAESREGRGRGRVRRMRREEGADREGGNREERRKRGRNEKMWELNGAAKRRRTK